MTWAAAQPIFRTGEHIARIEQFNGLDSRSVVLHILPESGPRIVCTRSVRNNFVPNDTGLVDALHKTLLSESGEGSLQSFRSQPTGNSNLLEGHYL